MSVKITDSQGNIDLSDPQLVEQLIEIDVNKTDVAPTVEEKEIRELEQLPDSVPVSLNKEQVALLQREARTLKISWEQHLHNLIQENIFTKAVGRSIISAPRIGGGKVVAPIHKVRTISANAAAQETD